MCIDFNNDYFIITISEYEIKKERAKAKDMRKKQWWRTLVSKGICHYCSEKFPASEITMDHVVPVIRGGKSTKGNLVAACKECNNKKKHMLPIEWGEYLKNIKESE